MNDISKKLGNTQAPASSNAIGLSQKEQAPISSKVKSEISAIIEESEVKQKEIKEVGKDAVRVGLDLTKIHKGTKDQTEEIALEPTQAVGIDNLPGQDEITKTIKITDPTNQLRWYNELAKKVLKALGLWKKK